MQDHSRELMEKTAVGAATWVGTYFATLTIADVQAYSIIFASVATGLYYFVQALKTVLSIRKKKGGEF